MTWKPAAGGAAATVAVAAAVVIGFLDSWSADTWTAVATWITAVVAAAAAYAGLHQLAEARHLRRAQAQPYVVVYIEPSAASSVLVDLVLKNFGTTAAHDVHLTISPAPERAIDDDRPPGQRRVWLPERIPVLVPGQEWRTLWDTGIKRYENGQSRLPEYHEATVTYTDFNGEHYDTDAVLDWRTLTQREAVTVYGVHHAAEALRDIRKSMGAWKEGPRGLRVYVRDGDARDKRAREELEQRRARQATDDTAGPERDAQHEE